MDILLQILHQKPPDGWKWLFDPKNSAWSKGNALTLANCAVLVYSDKDAIEAQLRARGFGNVVFQNDSASGTQAFIAERNDATVIAFRGTEPSRLDDIATITMARQVPFENFFPYQEWGEIHQGIGNAALSAWRLIITTLNKPGRKNIPVWLTGHSLGGALAMIMAAALCNTKGLTIGGVHTFGQPRIGSPAFARRYEKELGQKTFRYVNDRDIVTHFAPRKITMSEALVVGQSSGFDVFENLARAIDLQKDTIFEYQHTGQLYLLRENQSVSHSIADEDKIEPTFLTDPTNPLTFAPELALLLLQTPVALKDHAMINPVTKDGYIERLNAL